MATLDDLQFPHVMFFNFEVLSLVVLTSYQDLMYFLVTNPPVNEPIQGKSVKITTGQPISIVNLGNNWWCLSVVSLWEVERVSSGRNGHQVQTTMTVYGVLHLFEGVVYLTACTCLLCKYQRVRFYITWLYEPIHLLSASVALFCWRDQTCFIKT